MVRLERSYIRCQSLINLLYLDYKYNTLYVIVKSSFNRVSALKIVSHHGKEASIFIECGYEEGC